MKDKKHKNIILEQLKQLPIVEVACKKTGISRATFYRWKKEDKKFFEEVSKAILEGESLITDMSESQLIGLVRDKNFSAIQLWLKHHHPKYANKIELSGNLNIKEEPLTEKQKELVQEALKLSGLLTSKITKKDDEK